MRYVYYLIFTALVVGIGVGVMYFGREWFETLEKNLSSNLQANLVGIEEAAHRRLSAMKKSQSARLLFAGDVMLARGVAREIGKARTPWQPFLEVADDLARADLVFGNLEGPISTRGKNQGSQFSFRADPEVIDGLLYAGFDVVSLANNHVMDWGRDAFIDTIRILENNGIAAVGGGASEREANAPRILKIKNLRAALFAYTTLPLKSFEAKGGTAGISSFNLEKASAAITSVIELEKPDIVIVSFHWGEEYDARANESEKKIAHTLIDAGADLVVGHHPHVAQEVEEYKGAWIAYSLGNFVFDQNFSKETRTGLLLEVNVGGRKIREVVPRTIFFTDAFQPILAPRE